MTTMARKSVFHSSTGLSIPTTSRSAIKRILFVDDHSPDGERLRSYLGRRHDLEFIGETDTEGEAIAGLEHSKPDLVILHLSLGPTDCLKLIRKISRRYSFPILVISRHDESLYAEMALRAGARRYIMRNEPLESVLDAIRSVLDGNVYLSARMKSKILKLVAADRGRNELGNNITTGSDEQSADGQSSGKSMDSVLSG